MIDNKMLQYGVKIYNISVKASRDPAYKKELKKDPVAIFKKEGINLGEGRTVKILENSDKEFHIAVPAETYPPELQLKTLPKNPNMDQVIHWVITQIQSNSPLTARILNDTEALLTEKGVSLPKEMKVIVSYNSPKVLYLVLPVFAKDAKTMDSASSLNDFELQAVAGGKGGGGGNSSTSNLTIETSHQTNTSTGDAKINVGGAMSGVATAISSMHVGNINENIGNTTTTTNNYSS